MLKLLQSYTGSSPSDFQYLALPHETLLLYPSADSIVLLNPRTLAFVRALAFWEAFPSTRGLSDPVQCLAVEPGMKLVVASLGSRVAAWCLADVNHDSWRLHSTLLRPQDERVTALDCRSGLLAVGTQSSLSVYTLILENDLPTWSQKWSIPVLSSARVRFSPSLELMCANALNDNIVRIYLTTSGRQTQTIPHPRPLTDLTWRTLQVSNRDALALYTTTRDGTLRVFLSVLDTPNRLQLHAVLDGCSALPLSYGRTASSIFPLDRGILDVVSVENDADDARLRRIQEIKDNGWDLFLRVLSDGAVVIQAVANIDRRPPTLLNSFTLLHSPPGLFQVPPTCLRVLPPPKADVNSRPSDLILVASSPLASYSLAPLSFFDARENGLRQLASLGSGLKCQRMLPSRIGRKTGTEDTLGFEESKSTILCFVRTADGEAVGVLRENGEVETWCMHPSGQELIGVGRWESGSMPHEICVIYSPVSGLLTLHTTTSVSTAPTLSVPPLSALFSLPSPLSENESSSDVGSTELLAVMGVTVTHNMMLFTISLPSSSSSPSFPSITLRNTTSLPLHAPPAVILPVDPMAWSDPYGGYGTLEAENARDILISVSDEGDLAFWAYRPSERPTLGSTSKRREQAAVQWQCTGKVHTGRRNLRKVACSSAKKTVLVVPHAEGEELTIWDSKESAFASGLEYRQVLPEPINDLDWTATPDGQSILAIGFSHRVELLCQQRMTYFDNTPGWGVCWRIDFNRIMPHGISDSIWLGRGSLLAGIGSFMFLFGQPAHGDDKAADRDEESLFEHVARHNGPLDDYHPQMLLQCLLWEKIELVKRIVVNLAQNVESGLDVHEWSHLSIEDFLQKDDAVRTSMVQHKPKYSALFSIPETRDEPEDDAFSPSLVRRLLDHLEDKPLPHLTPNEHATLLVLIQTTLEIQEQRRALDANGLRYLISMRVFYILNQRVSEPSTPASSGAPIVRLPRRTRLRYRDMIWASHSESQELLLSASAACNGKMCWPDARALGVFIWLNSVETMKAHMETLARNQFMAGDARDPTACSLFYFALGKHKLVHGLWRQAAWHKEQAVMLKFLGNDFSQSRWRTAALKNAFALLSKRRFEYAAAFFLLGGSLKDAVNVCVRNLKDFQLAVALARVVEQGDEGPVMKGILNDTVVPIAFKEGNRWLASWAFWLLHRRDLAVRILVTPLQDVARVLDLQIMEIGDPHYDDPSLALLFSELRSKTLQAAKGTSEISGRIEFNFVLQIARVFCRMGCHVLALDLVRSWSFIRPSIPSRRAELLTNGSSSPALSRFVLEPIMRRHSSIMIDMDLLSAPPTRKASPAPTQVNGTSASNKDTKDDGDLVARKAGLGSLMKSAKQDVQVPEFDMNAFF
ncbi:WD repeat-containing protein [Obba rivulosa]|uniref:WD repeat-containing protein n=1 Tax=Obba rivulosa TaxID=1052685 RepID=A0A8E2J6N3_9APHY|nr:WD repeat-containing protein [Obba rivulosa]